MDYQLFQVKSKPLIKVKETSKDNKTPQNHTCNWVRHQEFLMDQQQRIVSVASSSNCSSMMSSKKYDVFLSFRGEDTRKNFISHLYIALNEKSIETYIDDRLQNGDEISTALTEAIEDSHVSIVIFSENYASSKWCLEELIKILECKKVRRQIVIPVFYNIDPSNVRKQSGSYAQAFAKHEGDSRCNKWKAALTEAANIAGLHSQNYRTDSDLLKGIIGDVLKKLPPRYPNQHEGLFGIEEHLEKLELLLKIGSSEVKTLGIWGMGGVGKTTLATALYDKLSYEFDCRCFLVNVREKSDKLDALRDELFSKLFGENNRSFDTNEIRRRLQHKKVFIVLDDAASSEQLEKLIVDYGFLGPGSRVIVTTRDKQILRTRSEIYPVRDLSSDHSLQLFCLAVFGEKQPEDGYEDVSRKMILYCRGNPLALKVLGASLRSKTKNAWEEELRKLQLMPNMEIHKVLKLSFDGLDHLQQNIFLDIACFFKGEDKDYVTSALEAFDFFPASATGIEALVDKALITISKYNEIEMHDLIQDMGWKIVAQESIKDLGRRSRLWEHEEVIKVLKRNKGTDVVEGIILYLDKLNADLDLSSDSLAKMTNMRFLKMTNMRFLKIYDSNYRSNSRFKVNLPNGLESLSDKLRYLEWDGCCLESLPPNFCAEELVEIIMPGSKLKKLWDGVQNLVNLKKIDLSNSQELIEIPDFSKAENLETVDLKFCESLHELHPSIFSHPKLTCLLSCGCTKIERLNVDSKSLRELDLEGCSSPKEVSETSKEMTKVDLTCTAICALSSLMLSFPKLTYLNLTNCKEIESLDLYSKSLRKIYLQGCSSLEKISVTLEEMEKLVLTGTAICASSSSMLSLPKWTYFKFTDSEEIESLDLHSKSLRELYLEGCSSLKKISLTSDEMTKLDLIGTAICALSSSIVSLPKLTYLNLTDCKKIESLDLQSKFLKELSLEGCSSLKKISLTSKEMTKLDLSGTAICALSSSILCLPKLTYLNLTDCKQIESLDLHATSLRELYLARCSSLKEISVKTENLIELNFNGCSSLKVISVTSKEMTQLDLSGTAIRALPSWIGHLLSLESLNLSKSEVESLELNIKNLPMLRSLWLDNCRNLVSLQELPPSLRELGLDNCTNLVSLPELPPSLDVVSAYNCISLEIEITQQLVLQNMLVMLQSSPPNLHIVFPGDHVTNKSGFRIAGSVITIPCLPLSHLCGFICCIILSEGPVLYDIFVSIYQDDIEIGCDCYYEHRSHKSSISDHVIFWYLDISKLNKIVYDYFNDITYIFGYGGGKARIKGCAVFPVYATALGFKLVGSKEILEWETITQVSDNEPQPRAIGVGVGCSNNEHEDDREHLLPTSKRRRSKRRRTSP